MEILGNIGIDIKLLIAQIINFGLLLWLLKKLLYKPIIKRIEEDEKELNEAQAERKRLREERNAFDQQRKKELEQARRAAEQIIAEGKEMAGKIKEKARETAAEEIQALSKMARDRLSLQKHALEEDIFEETKREIKMSLQNMSSEVLPDKARKVLEEVFFDNLIQRLEKLKLEAGEKLKDVVEEWEKSNKFFSREERKESLEDFVSAKLGPVAIWSVRGLSKEREKKLTKVVAKKLGVNLGVKKAEDKSMVVGFRLEIAGFLLESNLWQIIDYGFKQSENR